MKIYTGTGDKGKTSTYDGVKLPKNDVRVEAYGTIDELNSTVGLLKNFVEDPAIVKLLHDIQRKLFNVAGELATVDANQFPEKISEEDIKALEDLIDHYIDLMGREEAFSFIIPGSNIESGYFHVARTICRRAERRIINLNNALIEDHSPSVSPLLLKYINRLSDALYTLGRYEETLQEKVIFKENH